MKKHILLLLLATLFSLVSGCAKTEQDPYKSYRQFSSTQLFEDGERALAKKKYDRASKYLEAMDALYPFSPHTEQAQLDIIYAYYMNDDAASSITAADRFVRIYPRSIHADYAYYMRGVVSFSLGLSWLQRSVGVNPGSRDMDNLQQAFTAFSMVEQQYPTSRYAPDSIARMAYIRNLLANREVSVAEFYMERKAFVAATNRASYVVQHFSGAPAVPKALAIMVRGYRALGLTDMATASYQLLQANYPDSAEFHDLHQA